MHDLSWFNLGLLVLVLHAPGTEAGAQPTSAPSAPPATAPLSAAEAARPAEEWVGRPESDERIESPGPAVGIRLRRYATPRPLRVWIARIDMTAPGVRPVVTEPLDEARRAEPKSETLSETTLEFAQRHGVQLAVNTSAFGPLRDESGQPMDVVGLAAVEGNIYSQPQAKFGALYVGRDGRIALRGPPLPTEDVWHVVPGFRMLVDDGVVVVSEEESSTKFGGLHPRTAVGVDRSGGTLWIVVADGRQPGVSEGTTLVELAGLFRSLGAWDALNLDGGGSTTLVARAADGRHQVVNTPIHGGKPGGLRRVANNLGFILPQAPSAGEPTTREAGGAR